MMHKLLNTTLILCILLLNTYCKKKDTDVSPVGFLDKQIRLPFPGGYGLSSSEVKGFLYQDFRIIKFNKSNYPGVDSIVFAAQIKSADSRANGIVELVNLTDNAVVNSSLIKSNNPSYTIVESKNMFKELPNKEITLAIKVRSEQEGVLVSGYLFELFLYRKK